MIRQQRARIEGGLAEEIYTGGHIVKLNVRLSEEEPISPHYLAALALLNMRGHPYDRLGGDVVKDVVHEAVDPGQGVIVHACRSRPAMHGALTQGSQSTKKVQPGSARIATWVSAHASVPGMPSTQSGGTTPQRR